MILLSAITIIISSHFRTIKSQTSCWNYGYAGGCRTWTTVDQCPVSGNPRSLSQCTQQCESYGSQYTVASWSQSAYICCCTESWCDYVVDIYFETYELQSCGGTTTDDPDWPHTSPVSSPSSQPRSTPSPTSPTLPVPTRSPVPTPPPSSSPTFSPTNAPTSEFETYSSSDVSLPILMTGIIVGALALIISSIYLCINYKAMQHEGMAKWWETIKVIFLCAKYFQYIFNISFTERNVYCYFTLNVCLLQKKNML